MLEDMLIDLLNLYFICMKPFYMLIGIFMKCITFQCNDKLFFLIFFSLILMSHVLFNIDVTCR
jgi:hypothetical protein